MLVCWSTRSVTCQRCFKPTSCGKTKRHSYRKRLSASSSKPSRTWHRCSTCPPALTLATKNQMNLTFSTNIMNPVSLMVIGVRPISTLTRFLRNLANWIPYMISATKRMDLQGLTTLKESVAALRLFLKLRISSNLVLDTSTTNLHLRQRPVITIN